MKIKKLSFMVLSCLLFATAMLSCGKEDDKKNEGNNEGEKQSSAAIILDNNEYTIDELSNRLYGEDIYSQNGGEEVDELSRLRNQMREQFEKDAQAAVEEDGGDNGFFDPFSFKVEELTIQYPTIDANGNEIMLSGTLAIGKINGQYTEVKDILVNTHPRALDDDMLTMCSFTNLCTEGLAVLEPHYQGFGITTGMPQTYLCQKLIGQQCAEMIPAAIQIMKDMGVVISKDMGTYIIGYSQGGGNAMATARYLQEEAPESLRKLANVKKLNCGAGPYDPVATMNHWIESDTVSMTLVIPLVVRGMMAGHPDIMAGINLTDYFSDIYLSVGIVQSVGNPEVSKVVGVLSTDQSDALASIRYDGMAGIMQSYLKFSGICSEAFKDPNSHIHQALKRCLQMEVVNDWVPKCPVELFSSRTDNVIPYAINAVATYNKFRDAGVDVKLTHSLASDHILSQMMWMTKINTLKTYK